MRLPWNKKYLEITFHIVVTVFLLCMVGVFLFQLSEAKNVILQAVKRFLGIFSPLFFGLFFAVIVDPFVTSVQKRYENYQGKTYEMRKFSTAVVYGILFGVLGLIGTVVGRSLNGADFQALAQQILIYIEKMGDLLVLMNVKLAQWGILQNMENILLTWTDNMMLFVEESFLKIGQALPNIGTSFLDIFLGIVISIYFSIEKESFLRLCRKFSEGFLGEKKTKILAKMCGNVNDILIGYLGGQLIDASIMAVLFSVTFFIIGLPYGILLGVISGFSNIVPYFGGIVAFFLAIISAVLSGDPTKIVISTICIILLQQIDGLFIVPRVMGRKVELHPVMVILSLAVFGELFGFVGLLLAVPLGAFTKMIFLWGYERVERKRESL